MLIALLGSPTASTSRVAIDPLPSRPLQSTTLEPVLDATQIPGAHADVQDVPGVDPLESTPVPELPRPLRLTREALADVYAHADVPVEWREPLLDIAFCESSGGTDTVDVLAVGDFNDAGIPQSLSYLQLWRGWAARFDYAAEDLFDPIIAARVGAGVRAERGRFGGGGGWTCADLLGIY